MPKRTKRNPDHVKRHNTPTIDNEAIANQLKALLIPAIAAQQKYYKELGLLTVRAIENEFDEIRDSVQAGDRFHEPLCEEESVCDVTL